MVKFVFTFFGWTIHLKQKLCRYALTKREFLFTTNLDIFQHKQRKAHLIKKAEWSIWICTVALSLPKMSCQNHNGFQSIYLHWTKYTNEKIKIQNIIKRQIFQVSWRSSTKYCVHQNKESHRFGTISIFEWTTSFKQYQNVKNNRPCSVIIQCKMHFQKGIK